ncbi:CWF19-like protein 1 [Branchiostoma floridae x Branchiostoma belcheri]
MANKQLRILTCGDVEGRFSQLFKRVSSIQKKSGDFDMLLCVGDFFGITAGARTEWQQYLEGRQRAPIATYILGANKPEHLEFYGEEDGGELCENITYLGRKGVFTGASGLQIVYLSGVEGEAEEGCCFSKTDVTALCESLINKNFKGVDILLTSPWPRGVTNFGNSVEGGSAPQGLVTVAELAKILRPRYHFSGLEGVFYERLPYRNHRVLAESDKHVTRFLALAKVGNPEKKKYLYAFNLTPLTNMDQSELVKQPHDVTECPYKSETGRQDQSPEGEEDTGLQYRYDLSGGAHAQGRKRGHQGGDRGPGGEKKSRPPPKPTGPCWFCLASPEVEKHLVVSVGDHTYLALAKGGLVPDHVLILPIGHYQSMVEATAEVHEEIEKYKSALRKLFQSQGKECVFYERNYKTQHLQIQVVPVPSHLSEDVGEVFQEQSQMKNLELAELPRHTDLKQVVPSGAPYFYLELHSGGKFLHRIRKFFPLQFGREVMASSPLLDMPGRADWRNCKSSKEEETETAKIFRKAFQGYDFNLM